MKRKILINAKHPEEKRVAIVDGQILVDFYVEAASKEHLKGNIYKGVIKRIEPGLRAAFIDYGPKKHGFLKMGDVMPDYFKSDSKNKRPKIQDALTKGQELIVQVEREERDTKGASLTTRISLPGRYLVMMPGGEGIGISRKIAIREDRDRFKEIMSSLKLPKKTGFIVRTAGSDKTEQDLENDLKYLTKLWNKIQADSKKAHAPSLVYKEQDMAVRTVRDYLTSDINEVLIDTQDAFRNIKTFLRKTMPWRKINVTYYKNKNPIFDRYDLEAQINKLNENHVYLPSRGYLVIDKTEALTAIDVNSGSSRKEKDLKSLALNTNLEAAEEIGRQLRLRDIGGLIVIDFIDMDPPRHRREVENRLSAALASDRAQFDTSRISKFGMLEMTRERLRAGYLESTYVKCAACDGAGVVKTREMAAIAAFREIHMRVGRGGLLNATCRLHRDSANYLSNMYRAELAQMEKDSHARINIIADDSLIPGQYALEVETAPEETDTQTTESSKDNAPKAEAAENVPDKTAAPKAKKKRPYRKRSGRKKSKPSSSKATDATKSPDTTKAPEATKAADASEAPDTTKTD